MRGVNLGNILGLSVILRPSTFLGMALLTAVLIALATISGLDALSAVVAAILAMLLHYILEFLHQYGHSIAARMTGYPMYGITFWGILGTAKYPRDEGDLPARIHIRRALGGPVMSFVTSVVLLVLYAVAGDVHAILQFVLGVGLFISFVVLTIGALFPPIILANFQNDGGTILHWMRQRSS